MLAALVLVSAALDVRMFDRHGTAVTHCMSISRVVSISGLAAVPRYHRLAALCSGRTGYEVLSARLYGLGESRSYTRGLSSRIVHWFILSLMLPAHQLACC